MTTQAPFTDQCPRCKAVTYGYRRCPRCGAYVEALPDDPAERQQIIDASLAMQQRHP